MEYFYKYINIDYNMCLRLELQLSSFEVKIATIRPKIVNVFLTVRLLAS